jgi:hypothetical protein
VLVVVPIPDLLQAVGDEVSRLAGLEACPRVPPQVHPVLVHLPGQQRQLILAELVELLIWNIHQKG